MTTYRFSRRLPPTKNRVSHARGHLRDSSQATSPFAASPAEALAAAREAAGGQGIRLGGGATTIREFLAAGLVDSMHVAVVPILRGRGKRVRDGLEDVEEQYKVEIVPSPSVVMQVTFTRAIT